MGSVREGGGGVGGKGNTLALIRIYRTCRKTLGMSCSGWGHGAVHGLREVLGEMRMSCL